MLLCWSALTVNKVCGSLSDHPKESSRRDTYAMQALLICGMIDDTHLACQGMWKDKSFYLSQSEDNMLAIVTKSIAPFKPE